MRASSLFVRQLALMQNQGVPLVQALEVLSRQMPPQDPLHQAACAMVRDLEGGKTLSRAFQSQVGIFPSLTASMVHVGEQTGRLHRVLTSLADWMERSDTQRQNTRRALTYPFFVLAVVAVMFLLLLWGVVPSFSSILEELHTPLPWPTRMLLAASALLRNPLGCLAVVAIIGATSWTLVQYLRTPAGELRLFYLLRRTPLLGRLVECDAAVRFSDVLRLGCDSGLNYLKALQLAADISGHPLIREDRNSLLEAVRDGEQAGAYMRSFPEIYPSTLVNLLRGGEETGLISKAMLVARSTFELELDIAQRSLNAAFEPLLMVFVGLLVGGLVMALLLPLQSSLTHLIS